MFLLAGDGCRRARRRPILPERGSPELDRGQRKTETYKHLQHMHVHMLMLHATYSSLRQRQVYRKLPD